MHEAKTDWINRYCLIPSADLFCLCISWRTKISFLHRKANLTGGWLVGKTGRQLCDTGFSRASSSVSFFLRWVILVRYSHWIFLIHPFNVQLIWFHSFFKSQPVAEVLHNGFFKRPSSISLLYCELIRAGERVSLLQDLDYRCESFCWLLTRDWSSFSFSFHLRLPSLASLMAMVDIHFLLAQV